jgi:cob(I)alamin adenosyltransferase
VNGLVHLYTGDGKGKTTAAIGLAVRANGQGRRVVIAQFLKGRDSGELRGLAALAGVAVFRLSRDYGFVRAMDASALEQVRREHDAILSRVENLVAAGDCDLLVLDEATAACRHGLLDSGRLLRLLDARPRHAEVVLTGRDAPAALAERADYITEMRKVKHPFDRGVPAREGIEW